MKNLLLLSAVLLALSSCGDDKEELQKAVKFSITGNSVTDAKFNYKGTLHTIKTPFDGTRDTTIYANIGESVSLDAKSTGGQLKGLILVEGVLVSELVDTDTDQDGKTQVKLNFTVK